MLNSEQIESVFFEVIEDLKDYLENLTVVGGWLPHIYRRYFWKNAGPKPITTYDIDFGLIEPSTKLPKKTIFQTLSSLDYKERHLEIGKSYPIVLYKEGKIPVEFIADPSASGKKLEKISGKELVVNRIEKFEFLLKHRIAIVITRTAHSPSYRIYFPSPPAFLFHKAATFIDREYEQKQAKDLYYIYFILRYAPDIESILKEVSIYNKSSFLKGSLHNLGKFFQRKSSQGCLMVEKENGPDEYLSSTDLRQDIFERFGQLINIKRA